MLIRYVIFATVLLAHAGLASASEVTEQVVNGEEIFQENCAVCHGEDAKEGDSGDIRDVDLQQVTMATGGFEDMPEFEFEKDELKAIVTYLNSLID